MATRYEYVNTFKELTEKYPLQEGRRYDYGTAGFRFHASVMPPLVARMGLLAGLRSKFFVGAAVGLVITASHNPIEDNGIKVVDMDGCMLADAWEPMATRLANVPDADLEKEYHAIANEFGINLDHKGMVFIGHDNRPSRDDLLMAAKHGSLLMKRMDCRDFGLSATPEIHWMVWARNNGKKHTVDYYWDSIAINFRAISYTYEEPKLPGARRPLDPIDNGNYIGTLCIDGANGVAASTASMMKIMLIHHLRISVDNDTRDPEGILNHECGADYVKVNQCPPKNSTAGAYDRCCSYDGDADRIVYYYKDEDGFFYLLDGDKIAVLLVQHIQDKLEELSLTDELKVGCVQTAYSNGASTKWLEDKGVEVACTLTGVKHLHKKALEYDIGVYFEANGHGTVLYSKKAQEMITTLRDEEEVLAKQACEARGYRISPPFYRIPMLPGSPATKLYHFMMCANHTVGDAAADMCLVEIALKTKGWSIQDWDDMYTSFPNRLAKVKVADRRVIKTFDAERQVSEPEALQPAINALVTEYKSARSFVRPSGTEDVVRVYAEAETQEQADHLAARVSCAVYDLANGVGDRPTEPSPLGAKRLKV